MPYKTDTDTNNAAGAKLNIDRLQAEATAFSLANRRSEASNLYVPGKRTGTTPEQAFCAALEANPDGYDDFRAKHNSAALVAQLKQAGYRISSE
jgi:hypothetical protein